MDNTIEKLKIGCFDGLADRSIYIYGAGENARYFICMYRYDYDISGVISFCPELVGNELCGYTACSPQELKSHEDSEYKVIICDELSEELILRLAQMGISSVGVFDAEYCYSGRQARRPGEDGLKAQQHFYTMPVADTVHLKKYHIGYIAGVFDLFHVGHLNLIRRAKSLCDYLIVGVVSDRGVREKKHTVPVVPFEERMEIVRACRYVDEAVEIPFDYCTTIDAYKKYHFDVQFSGSDYENDEGWLYMRDYLRSKGSDMVFFPYTQQTSSTKIKEKL